MYRLLALTCLALSACAAPPPQLEGEISQAARAADFPELIPLSSFADIDALLPEDRDQVGGTLEARAASLRRRAAALRALPVQ